MSSPKLFSVLVSTASITTAPGLEGLAEGMCWHDMLNLGALSPLRVLPDSITTRAVINPTLQIGTGTIKGPAMSIEDFVDMLFRSGK